MAFKTMLSTTPDIYALQIGVDAKIYVCKSFNQFLGEINSPALPGTTCNCIDQGPDLDPNFMGVTSALGLPGFVQSSFTSETNCAVGIAEVNSANGVSVFQTLHTNR